MEKQIPVIIPAYEPDEKMIRLLQTLQEAGIERIVVVDDGSGNEYRNLFEQRRSERLPRIRTDNIRPPAFRNVWKRWKKSRKS